MLSFDPTICKALPKMTEKRNLFLKTSLLHFVRCILFKYCFVSSLCSKITNNSDTLNFSCSYCVLKSFILRFHTLYFSNNLKWKRVLLYIQEILHLLLFKFIIQKLLQFISLWQIISNLYIFLWCLFFNKTILKK